MPATSPGPEGIKSSGSLPNLQVNCVRSATKRPHRRLRQWVAGVLWRINCLRAQMVSGRLRAGAAREGRRALAKPLKCKLPPECLANELPGFPAGRGMALIDTSCSIHFETATLSQSTGRRWGAIRGVKKAGTHRRKERTGGAGRKGKCSLKRQSQAASNSAYADSPHKRADRIGAMYQAVGLRPAAVMVCRGMEWLRKVGGLAFF